MGEGSRSRFPRERFPGEGLDSLGRFIGEGSGFPRARFYVEVNESKYLHKKFCLQGVVIYRRGWLIGSKVLIRG